EITAKQDRIKQLHDYDVKWGLGLPIFAHKGTGSDLSNKWTKSIFVTPAVAEWVTDYGEAEGRASRVRLSLINWPDGTKKSLYTDDQKKQLFKSLFGHIYKLSGKELERVLAAPEVQQLATDFATKIDEGGFDFPMKISLKG